MKRIVILGCENSHADHFARAVSERYSDVCIIGAYSEEEAAATAFSEKYAIPILPSPNAARGACDGVIVTARNGSRHLPYVKDYLPYGIPVFMDKPITSSVADALEMAKLLHTYKNPYTGGSCLRYCDRVAELRRYRESETGGRTLGGIVRAPVTMENPYGGFWFYAQHLVESVCEIFGRFPHAVNAMRSKTGVTVVFRYEEYDVTGIFTDGVYSYHAACYSEKGESGGGIDVTDAQFAREFDEFYRLFSSPSQPPLDEFMSPVYIMDAIERSILSGREECVFRLLQ